MLVGTEARSQVFLQLSFQPPGRLWDDMIKPQGACERARNFDIVVARSVPSCRDAESRTNARHAELEQDVARVASSAQWQGEGPLGNLLRTASRESST